MNLLLLKSLFVLNSRFADAKRIKQILGEFLELSGLVCKCPISRTHVLAHECLQLGHSAVERGQSLLGISQLFGNELYIVRVLVRHHVQIRYCILEQLPLVLTDRRIFDLLVVLVIEDLHVAG